MKIFLTSSTDYYYKDENGNRISQKFSNINGIYDNLKKYIKKFDNFLFVASSEDNIVTDNYANLTFDSFNLTMPFKNYKVLDNRNISDAEILVKNADLIYLCGGHVPTQHKLFEKLNLKELLKTSNAVILGQSAGSMNMSNVVYAQPELDGEYVNKNYIKYFNGLDLVKFNIIPHYENLLDVTVDGVTNKQICIMDSFIRPFIAYSDGAYVFQNDDKIFMCGKAYAFNSGKKKLISKENCVTDITNFINKLYKGYNDSL